MNVRRCLFLLKRPPPLFLSYLKNLGFRFADKKNVVVALLSSCCRCRPGVHAAASAASFGASSERGAS